MAPRVSQDVSLVGQLATAAEVIAGADELSLACHVHPDGDALGSMLAFDLLARANGCRTWASWPTPFELGPHYQFLPGLDTVVPPVAFPVEPEVMVTFDLGSFERLGDLAPAAHRAHQLIVLDHHGDNHRFGTINVVETGAAATAVVVRELAAELGWPLTRDVALCLYVGLLTDTGRFRYPNTTPAVFALAEELVSFGLSVADITRELFERHRFQYLRLAGEVLGRAHLDPGIGFVAAWLTEDDLVRFDVAFDETEGLIDLVRSTSEADVACVLKEAPGEGLRVSLRSDGPRDVASIAAAFGGGGHWFMSGFTTDDPIGHVIDELRSCLGASSPYSMPDPPT